MRAVIGEAFEELGRVDVIVSNAGYGILGAAEELTDHDVEALLATNLTASIHLARVVTPYLREQGGGTILQVSSMGAHIAFPGFAMYHASKWGVEGFFEAFAAEVAPFGIRSVLVEPGVIRTSFYDAAQNTEILPAYAGREDILRGADPSTRIGDQTKVVKAMIDVAQEQDPPRRLVLGSDAHDLMRGAIESRLAEVAAQREHASTTDADWYVEEKAVGRR